MAFYFPLFTFTFYPFFPSHFSSRVLRDPSIIPLEIFFSSASIYSASALDGRCLAAVCRGWAEAGDSKKLGDEAGRNTIFLGSQASSPFWKTSRPLPRPFPVLRQREAQASLSTNGAEEAEQQQASTSRNRRGKYYSAGRGKYSRYATLPRLLLWLYSASVKTIIYVNIATITSYFK